MAVFFEFALMRIRTDIDQKYISELYFQYMSVEEVVTYKNSGMRAFAKRLPVVLQV